MSSTTAATTKTNTIHQWWHEHDRTTTKNHQWWDRVTPAIEDPITGVSQAFLSDTSPLKINLGTGTYRDDDGKPVVLECVRKAQAKIAGSEFLEFSVSGTVASKLVEESVKLTYGNDFDVVKEKKFAGIQTLSGTGACRLFAEFQRRFYPESQIYLPEPTWPNHHNIWREAHVRVNTFRYYDAKTNGLYFSAILDDIKNAPDGSFFLLHPCAHNPTGTDPTEEQWREISHHLKVKNHFPFFDVAYQGMASGNLDKDAKAIRILIEDGHLVACAQSFSKNMGLHGHRVGCLSVLCADNDQAIAVRSQFQQIVRALYSSPPVHGILLVSTILNDPELRKLWEAELEVITNRMLKIRAALRQSLEESNSSLSWEHLTNQVGMFWFSGLSPNQIEQLRSRFHIYITPDSRISIAGIAKGNVEYVANAIHEVTRS